ncbi:MAG: PKD domain-containing protein [Bacteroidota bacterium]|nr:PKD domain-containing protein [Bacteroidota bacterium]
MTFPTLLSARQKSVLLLCLGLSAFAFLNAQDYNRWIELKNTPNTNFYTIKNAFDSAYAGHEAEMRSHRGEAATSGHRSEKREQEGEGLDGSFSKYKRWEWYMEPRVYPSGNMALTTTTYQRFTEYLNNNPDAMMMHNASIARSGPNSNSVTSNPWTFVGPTGAPTGSGAGRLSCVRFDPANSNIIYVGAPAGGLWKSIDAGQTWTCLTDFLPAIGCSDVAIDPNNSNIIYLASGDNDAGDSPSIGVLKSTDGGITWNQTGLTFGMNSFRRIGRLLIDPMNSNILYAATSNGIYKTWDAGVNWYRVSQSSANDLEFKPGDSQTLYATRTALYKSTNGGATWTQIASGLPQSANITRMCVAVTPAAPDWVYVLTANSNTYAFEGLYLSMNSASSFNQQSSSPNLMGWDTNGNDSDGQGWYSIALGVSPYNENLVIVGGVNVWRSDDQGSSWNLNAHWYGGGGAPYVHADIHDIVFHPTLNDSYFIGCDGGIFKTEDDGASFADLSSNLSIAQIYRGDVSGTNPSIVISGHQDNGTNVKTGLNYFSALGGDGMDCFIDRTNDNNMFGSIYYGDFYKSNDGGNNWNGITNGTPGNGEWVTPWEQDPINANILYSGFDQLYKSTNQGNSWFAVGSPVFGANLTEIEVCPSNTNSIYVATGSNIFRSTDGGNNWNSILGILSGYAITNIAVSSYDENKVWVTVSGYNNNAKVFFSANGGTTWSNISYGLPNIPANCIVTVPGTSSDAIFVGMDVGVYYHDNSSATWIPFFTSLPNTPIFDLDIFLPTMKLVAFTYGRGVWEASIDQSLFTPYADFSATPLTPCPGQTVQFTDLSTFTPSSWSWSFPGGTPSTSSAQNPAVVYNTPGTYPVTLITTNAAGSGTTTRTSYITVNGAQQPPYIEGFVSATFLPQGWSLVNPGNQTYFWKRSATVGYNSTESAYFDNFNYTVNNDQDEMRSMAINFTGYTSLAMTFDVAYARYNSTRSDTLEVLVSADCGATWTSLYLKGGATLSTAANQTTAFIPTNSQWRTETINISAYAGQNDVLFAFRNHGRHGNNLYVDNINISAVVNAAPVASFTTTGTICENAATTFTDLSAPAATSWSWTFPGGNPSSSSLQNPVVSWNAAGTYTVSLVSGNGFGSDSVAQVITVNAAPVADAGIDTAYCKSTYVQLNAGGGVSYSWSPSAALSNPFIASPGVFTVSSATYSVTVTDVNGCSSTDTVHLTVYPTPSFTVNGSPSSICYGDTLLLYANSPSLSYAWSPASSLNTAVGDSAISFPAMTTTYTITATDTNGCTNSYNKTITVYPLVPTPAVLVFGWTLVCSTPAAFYQWYLNGNPITGATSQYYIASTVGNYTVEAHNVQNCLSGMSQPAFVNAIKEEAGPEFVIAPNPGNGIFDLSFTASKAISYSIHIFSADGKLVYIEELSHVNGNYKKQIDLSVFGPGLYLVRIADGKRQSVQHVIVY